MKPAKKKAAKQEKKAKKQKKEKKARKQEKELARAAAAQAGAKDAADRGAAQGVGPEKLAKLVAVRLKERAAQFARAKASFERVAKGLQQLVASASVKPVKGGPRRFRPATTKAREYQQRMSELGTEMRLITARRAELAWLQQQLTGAAPQLSPQLRELLAQRKGR